MSLQLLVAGLGGTGTGGLNPHARIMASDQNAKKQIESKVFDFMISID